MMFSRPLKISIIFIAAALAFGCQSSPPKPELRGEGPLAVRINDKATGIPEYHTPIETWRVRHMNNINDGNFRQQDCFICHQAKTSCNNCHDYVGVARVIEPYLPKGFDPEKNVLPGTENAKPVNRFRMSSNQMLSKKNQFLISKRSKDDG